MTPLRYSATLQSDVECAGGIVAAGVSNCVQHLRSFSDGKQADAFPIVRLQLSLLGLGHNVAGCGQRGARGVVEDRVRPVDQSPAPSDVVLVVDQVDGGR